MKRISTDAEYLDDGKVVIDADGIGVTISGKADQAAVDSALATKADKSYVDAEKWNKGDLGTNDLNDVTTPGMWHQRWSSVATPERNYPTKQAGVLQVAKSRTLVSQTFTTLSGYQQVWIRYFSAGNAWSAWVLVNQQWGRGQLGVANLDDVVTAGYYHQQNVDSATPDRSYPVNEPGILEVLVNGERIFQRYTDMTAPSIQYVRYSAMEVGVRVWRPWERIGLSDSAEIIVEADYTGVSDAQPAIQAAIEKGKTEGKPVRLLAGKLKLNKAITAVDKLVLRGAGMGKTILLPQGQANAIEYKAGTEGEPISDVIFSDFDIDGKDQIMPSGGYAPTQTKGAFIEKMHRIEMRNLHIRNTGATGLGIDHVTGVIENVWAVNCGRFNGGNKPGGSGIGIGTGWLDPVFEPLTIANCHTIGNARFGIFIESQTDGAAPSGITITGCTARGNKDGIGDAGGTGAIITGNHVIENTRSGIDVDHGTLSQGAPGLQTKVIANDIRGNATGITIYVKPDRGLDGVQIVDNTIIDNFGDGLYFNADTNDSVSNPVRNLRITGNEISRNLGRGIYIEGDRYVASLILRRFWIARNRVWENAVTGIHINGQTDGLVMEGNIIWDDQQEPTQTAAVLVERTHTNFVERENIWSFGSVAIPTA